MDGISTSTLIVTLTAMILSGFFSGMEIAFVSASHVRASVDAQKGGLINRIVNKFYDNSAMVISTLLLGNNIVLVIYSMGMANILSAPVQLLTQNEALIVIIQTIIATLIILVTGEYIPKTVFRINPNGSLRAFALPLLLSYYVLYPISWLSSKISKWLMRLAGVKQNTAQHKGIEIDELEAYLDNNIDRIEDNNKEVEHEVKIFRNALDFSDTHLRDCMIPRNEITAVDIENTNREQLCARFISTGLSKIVVYQNDIDNIIGYIHVCELFTPDVNWKERTKPVLYAPETMLANKMMQQLLSEKKSMAVVIDEFGGTAGLVTLEDLVEEIFGDIEDEHDRKSEIATIVSEGVYDFSGRAEIDTINEQYHLDIPEDNDKYQTLGGLLLHHLETMPLVGDTLTLDKLKFTVTKASATRIEQVRVEQL